MYTCFPQESGKLLKDGREDGAIAGPVNASHQEVEPSERRR